jgi:hypothetical protein
MSDQPWPARTIGDASSPLDELIAASSSAVPTFTTAFRGYERDEVDATIADLLGKLHTQGQERTALELRARQVEEGANDELDRLQEELDAATARRREESERLEADLAAANARADDAEGKVEALTQELLGAGAESGNRHHFEEVLRVAEEQASQLIKNASVQGDRLLESAREEIQSRRTEAQADADAIRAQAHHEAQQARLKIETELTAHQAQLEREAAHAAEKVVQAEQEAAVIRTEAEKGAAALRALVERETTLARTEAEEAVRVLRLRTLEFEESLTRRQDDAQQEFLVLHNQAVAHAERITQDANDQVTASIDHAQRVQAKADDFDRLMRAQAKQIEADAHIRAREHLDRATTKAQKIIDTITTNSQSVLRDAEDRSRQLRWQQHQLTSFMAEVRELIRPEGGRLADDGEDVGSGDEGPLGDTDAAASAVGDSAGPGGDSAGPGGDSAGPDGDSAGPDGERDGEASVEESAFVGDPGFVGDEPLDDEPVALPDDAR